MLCEWGEIEMRSVLETCVDLWWGTRIQRIRQRFFCANLWKFVVEIFTDSGENLCDSCCPCSLFLATN